MQGRHFWKYLSEPLRINALAFASEIDAEYLDQEAIAALKKMLYESPTSRKRLFYRLRTTRSIEHHPLNANFLDSTLREMSVSERDLIWTEWIRETYFEEFSYTVSSERFNSLLSMEDTWKQHLETRTASDRLRAKWLLWFLTSTDRELRDLVTRALYWFGRGNPTALFEETLAALEINDPYIPERMLAASYGVAMARHVDLEDQTFVNSTLPTYARGIYDAMFTENASFSTTHSLMREYGRRIVELASFHDLNLFSSEEIRRSKPPYQDGGLRDWSNSESSGESSYDSDSPFDMDFQNYTLGRLVPGRRNYDFQNEEYRRIRSQILWRIEQLGWSSENFSDIDSSIAHNHRWGRVESDAKKIDRYGKKYSWIAFFEMSGLLHDLGIIDRENERDWDWDLDIDPSFPEQLPDIPLIQTNFLGSNDTGTKEWIADGPSPDVNPYLRLANLNGEEGSWVMLDGYITQEDKTIGRSLFCFIRSFLVLSSEADSFCQHLSNQDLGGRWLPEKPSVGHTFAGEIPWCGTFPENEFSKLSFVEKEEIVVVERAQTIFFLDGKQLDLSNTNIERILTGINSQTDENQKLSMEEIERIEVREVPIKVEEVLEHSVVYSAIIPVRDFEWEGDRSAANKTTYATTLSKEIVCELKLIGQPQTLDFFTSEGLRATYNLSFGNDCFNNKQRLFYVREELLRTFLEENELSLIWAVWGERGYSSDRIHNLIHTPNRSNPTYLVYSYVKSYE
ncbi:hypothetical protein [Altericista sp. CCNU0014]|uniref:hypothetical protein n=1 Tax=Altericista sp. CCNU0014 TaxID=3082949 RepID=UPI0038513FEB